ncbi:MAG: glycosyltransferase family 2 protein [Pseudomonadota bacterium]
MIEGLNLVSVAIAVGIILPLLVFTVEVYLGFWPSRRLDLVSAAPSTCILIPAHNEAATIGLTLQRLKPCVWEDSLVLVVADNCTDETARIAATAGAEVLERVEPAHRGKDYALAFGRDHLRNAPPECVIVFDADCRAGDKALREIATCAIERSAAVQALNTFEADRSGSPMVQISSFAMWIKNVVRQRGAQRAGAGAVLTGTGMAFPWQMFDRLPLATGSIVEDLAIGANLTRAGAAPLFLEQASISSAAARQNATLEQRARWEHGFLSTAQSQGLPSVWTGLRTGNWKAIWLGLHLMVPPFALLISLALLILLFLGVSALATANVWPFVCVSAVLSFALAGLLGHWALEGHKWLHPRVLLLLPFYVLWKIPVYARYLLGRRSGWVRTER